MRLLFVMIAVCLGLSAEPGRSVVRGTVSDASGAGVGGVEVRLEMEATGFRAQVRSTEEGGYALAGLPVGRAKLRFEKAGFQVVEIERVELFGSETARQDVKLAIAAQTSMVEVRAATAGLNVENATIAAVIAGPQVDGIPLNGRNWQGLMLLAPGAVSTGVGDARGIRFAGHGQDDNNYKFDGVDATGVRNQVPRDDVRLAMPLESIAEFRVQAASYGAEIGGTMGAQVEVVSRSGGNRMHGSVFEYLRNDRLDARSPFDGARIPPFRLNQFGASVGGAVVRDRTFFFAAYEGLAQRWGRTLAATVPSESFRARAVAARPELGRVMAAYPRATGATSSADIGTWSGPGSQDNDQHSGMLRVDHRVSGRDTVYGRVSSNSMEARTPLGDGTGYLGAYNVVEERVTTGVVDYQRVAGARWMNDARVGFNRVPYQSLYSSPILPALTVAGLTKIPGGRESVVNSTTYTVGDTVTAALGRHTVKMGFETRRVEVALRTTADGSSLAYKDMAALEGDVRTSAQINGYLPTRGIGKRQYAGFVQDEWRARAGLTVTAGVRYEDFGVFSEKYGRAQVFDLESCGGFCEKGAAFTFRDGNNFAPRASLAWAPARLGGGTVVRAGFGMYYGEGQLGNQTSPVENETARVTLSGAALAATPLSALLDPLVGNGPATFTTTPLDLQRRRKDMYTSQWSMTVERALGRGALAEVGYVGGKGTQLFERTYYNAVDAATGRRPYPQWDLIRVRANGNDSSFHALMAGARRQTHAGFTFGANYQWSHALDNTTTGGDDADYPQNVGCRSCERASSNFDVRHNFNANAVYELPFGAGKRYLSGEGVGRALLGGWQVSGMAVARTGRPMTITVSRAAAALPDQNATSPQRPDLVAGVAVKPGEQTRTQWVNLAAFAVPAAGRWGTAGRNLITGPGAWNVDVAVARRVRVGERVSVELRAETFNAMNHPQLANPVVNISAPATFGRVTQLVNTGATGSGTPRQIQFAVRLRY